MKIKKICVLGGTGFVGRHLTTRLANRGYSLKVLTRHPQRHREVEVLPGTELVEADVHNPAILSDQFRGCDAVINLVGILHEYSGQSFRAVHAELPGKVAEACRAAGVQRLLHMSALGADAAKGPSQYLFTKGAGEQMVMAAAQGLAVTCFKPSIIFGPDDHFYNQFATLLKLSPVLPVACPNSRFAPVYVGDVTQAFEVALENNATVGNSYELCGPRIYTFKELVEDTARMLCLKRLVVGLPDGLARLQGKIMGILPVKFFTTDNYLSLQVDSVCSRNGLVELGITPHSVENIMPMHFAGDKSQRRRYDALRQTAGRA
ncbi:MAG: complex I NDUFA9 subunit family protein [Candidatus Competibacteraceae bacterium]|nr:MAG: complex I NDUFA9 subunit family protein [Candidatus Competibacteraceae bacterium]